MFPLYVSISINVFYVRFWLNTDVKTTDARLGWIQKTFELTGDEMRQLIVTEPRIIMFGVGSLEVSMWAVFVVEILELSLCVILEILVHFRLKKTESAVTNGDNVFFLQRLVTMLNEELEFTKEQVKAILLKDPRVFMMGE